MESAHAADRRRSRRGHVRAIAPEQLPAAFEGVGDAYGGLAERGYDQTEATSDRDSGVVFPDLFTDEGSDASSSSKG